MERMRQNGAHSVLWFVSGLLVGTAAGVLLAPKSGADTRQSLAASGRELYGRGRNFADEAAEMYDEARRLVEEARAAEA